MSTTIQRSPLTDIVLTLLRTLDWTVGDGVIPDSGWIGQPAAPGSRFKPFSVLSELRSSDSSGPIGDSQADWRMPYLLEVFGVTRTQAESLADRLRPQLASLQHQDLDLAGSGYRVQQVHTDVVGAPQRIDSVDPTFWHIQDGFTVWLGKRTTP